MCQKPQQALSSIPRDQIHGQLIDWLKNQTGIIENLVYPSTVCYDQVVCLELARLVREFEVTDKSDEWVHHKQYPELRSDYNSGVIALVVHLNS